LLWAREELLGLAPPTFPITKDAGGFARDLVTLGAPEELIGRDADLRQLVQMLSERPCVELIGLGGIGKSRLALAAAAAINTGRVRFLDGATPSGSDRLHGELAGADPLVLVIDNAHRRDDLAAVIAILLRRTGDTRLLLIARPGYDARLREALADTAFAQRDAVGRVELQAMDNADIGELVRAAEPPLPFAGSVEQIVDLAEGNPQIALFAHHAAIRRGGLVGFSRGEVLESYVAPTVDALVSSRLDVRADDLRDCLGLVALFGRVTPDEEDLLARLLSVSSRDTRHRLHDLADAGLIRDDGEARIAPDLLAAHVLRDAFFGQRHPTIRFAEAWEAASEPQRERMCAALGGLAGFAIEDRNGASQLLITALTELAASDPAGALRRAQSLAPGLPLVALACVDAVLEGLTGEIALGLCPTAMTVCARVPQFELGWPRQLAVAQICFAAADEHTAVDKEIREGLTQVYQRVPINTSHADGHILAAVQEGLVAITAEWADAHATEAGGPQTLALAAGQMLTVQFDRNYTSPEDELRVQMISAFVPGGERTGRVLRAGVRLLTACLSSLRPPDQVLALKPLASVRRYAHEASGPWGAPPDPELVRVCKETVADAVAALGEVQGLAVVTRSEAVDMLGRDPWPADAELADFRRLLVADHADDDASRQRPIEIAQDLLASDDLGATLARWRGWLVQAQTAGVRHSGGQRIADALDLAAQQQPERLMDALAAELRAADGLGPLCRWALATLFTRGETEAFARRLLVSAPTSARSAVALGLAATTAAWADSVLAELADDGEREVRAAVARAVGWGEPPSAMRVSAGLCACLPDDLFSVERLLAGLTREGRELSLGASALEVVHAILAATASAARPDGELVRDLIELCAIPRLAVEFLFARLNWLETEPANLSALLGRDGLPEELSDLARAGAIDADVQALCERLDRGDSNSSVRDAIVEMLSWIDPGDALSDRIADWLSDEEGPRDRIARELLREPATLRGFAPVLNACSASPPSSISPRCCLTHASPYGWWGLRRRSCASAPTSSEPGWAQATLVSPPSAPLGTSATPHARGKPVARRRIQTPRPADESTASVGRLFGSGRQVAATASARRLSQAAVRGRVGRGANVAAGSCNQQPRARPFGA